jgi:phage gp46-like protein
MGNDLYIYEIGDGGDASLNGSDLYTTNTIFNMVYLALFGGNPEASTTGNEVAGVPRFDWWGNSLIFEDTPSLQFNSLTEKTLNEIELSSRAVVEISNVVKKDLLFLNEIAEVDVDVSILSVDKVAINIYVNELGTLEKKEFQFIWNATKMELIEQRTI